MLQTGEKLDLERPRLTSTSMAWRSVCIVFQTGIVYLWCSLMHRGLVLPFQHLVLDFEFFLGGEGVLINLM